MAQQQTTTTTSNNNSMRRYSSLVLHVVVLLLLVATTSVQAQEQEEECVDVSITPNGADPLEYTLVPESTAAVATELLTASTSSSTTDVVSLCGCERLIFADRSWRPHVDDPALASVVTVAGDGDDDNTMMIAQRFGTASRCETEEDMCGATNNNTVLVPIQAFVHVRGQVPVTVTVTDATDGTTVWEQTTAATDLSYLSGCVPNDDNRCLSVCTYDYYYYSCIF